MVGLTDSLGNVAVHRAEAALCKRSTQLAQFWSLFSLISRHH